MKRLYAVLLVLVLILGLTGCGSSKSEIKEASVDKNSSNISIDQLSKAIGFNNDRSISVNQTENEDEIQFSVTINNSSKFPDDYQYFTGTATNKGMIKSLEYSFSSDEYTKSFYDSLTDNAISYFNRNYTNMPGYELAYNSRFANFTHIMDCLRGNDYANLSTEESNNLGNILVAAKTASKTADGWTYTMRFEEETNATIISAVYVGK